MRAHPRLQNAPASARSVISRAAVVTALGLAALTSACIDFRDGLACSTDADCDGYYCTSGKCVATRSGGGVAASFRIDSLPEHTKAGQAVTVQLTALDGAGNVVQNFSGSATLTASDAHAHLPQNPSFTSGSATAQVTFETVGAQTLTATQVDKSTVTGSAQTTVGPGDAASLVLAPANQTPNAGVAFRIDLTAKDAYGNVTTGYSGTVALTSSDAQAQLAGNTSFTNGAASVNVTLKTAGSQSITAHDVAANAITGAASVNVSGGAAASYTISGPSSASAGTAATYNIKAVDPYGNTAALYNGAANVTSTDAQFAATSTVFSAGLASGLAIVFKTAGAQSLTIADPGNSALTASQSVSVSPGAPSVFVITGLPASSTAGTTSTFSLTVRDAFANATPGYTGVVTLSSSDPQALFPQASVNFSAGGTLNNLVAQLRTAGAQSLFARDASAHVAGTGTLSVNAATWGGPNAFKWLQQPSTVQIGDVMSPAPVVQFLDAFGNATAGTSTTYGAPSISTSVLKTAFGSTHQGAYANGVTTFSALTLTPATYTTSTRLTIGTGTVTSDAFDITAPWIPLTDTVNPDKAVTTYGLVSGAGGELFYGGYHSTDRGRTWQLMSLVANAGACATLPPAAMIASSSTAGVVIGSSEETALGGSGCTAGTYRSTDSGAHWTRIAPTQTSVYATRTQDTQGGEVFLLASLTPISAGHFQPHLVSVSATGSTSTLDSGLPVSDVSYAQAPTLLVADLASTSTVYMTFGDCIANVTGAPCGLYTSANAGTSWTAVDTTGFQLPSNTACTPGFWGIKNLIPHPAGGLVIQTQYYFQCGGPSAGEALVHTTGGWTQLTTSVKLIGLYAFPDASHLYAQVIQNASVTKLSASTDGGATWVAAQTLGLPSVSNLWTLPDAWFAVSVNGSQQILNFERLPIP